ncbi:MAG: F0F1 ATP synthase subunit B [Gammaproteobacteria bacterium]|nr:F0F1 ATP synthase subunit B [Gammaproteobacteria bacterium]MBP9728739.1 F0F1 ATP synthase subunit B [Gammaproteobacteria bacterium]
MDINATLFGQMLTFAIFVWFSMKYVWPVLEKTLHERQQSISEGLAAAERGRKELEVSQKYAIQHIHEARSHALEIIEEAKKEALVLLEKAKKRALYVQQESVLAGKREIAQARLSVQDDLEKELFNLVVGSTEKVIGRLLRPADQKILLDTTLDKLVRKEAM